MILKPEQFSTYSLRNSPWGDKICQVLAAAINRADASSCIENNVYLDGNKLIIAPTVYDLTNYHRIFVIGAGKAVVPMTTAIYKILGNRIKSGIVITKDGYVDPASFALQNRVKIIQASHPVPDQRNLDASAQIITLTQNLETNDLVIFLLSGGGSSLLMKPSFGLSLKDIQDTIALLLTCGATIDEINTIRKHLDELKGGGLAKSIFPASIITLVLSDVVGDHLDVIASGPTVGDPTTYEDAMDVLNKYRIVDKIPNNVITHLLAGMAARKPETVKPGDPILARINNIMVGSNELAALAGVHKAEDVGFSVCLLTTTLQGEAHEVGKTLAENVKIMLAHSESIHKPACFIAGGETTVTVKGTGKGGRNQELALGAVKSLAGDDQMILVSLATDGGDGPTDAAGAVVTNQTFSNGQLKGLNSNEFLERNDSYHYFEPLGDLIKTGPTLTNVNDLVFIFCI